VAGCFLLLPWPPIGTVEAVADHVRVWGNRGMSPDMLYAGTWSLNFCQVTRRVLSFFRPQQSHLLLYLLPSTAHPGPRMSPTAGFQAEKQLLRDSGTFPRT